MSHDASTWDDLRRMADELEVKVHLGSMEARDRWRALQPRLRDLERKLEHSGERASKVVAEELQSIGDALTRLRDDIVKK